MGLEGWTSFGPCLPRDLLTRPLPDSEGRAEPQDRFKMSPLFKSDCSSVYSSAAASCFWRPGWYKGRGEERTSFPKDHVLPEKQVRRHRRSPACESETQRVPDESQLEGTL